MDTKNDENVFVMPDTSKKDKQNEQDDLGDFAGPSLDLFTKEAPQENKNDV